MSGLLRKEGWRSGGGLPPGYFDALFEYALTRGERRRREAMRRKLPRGEAGGRALPLGGGRATRATTPPLLLSWPKEVVDG